MASADTFLNLNATAWTGVTAIATALLFVAAVLAAIVGLQQLHSTVTTWREEARAYVIVDFESSPASVRLIDFVIRNIGRTPAFDVLVSWDPLPEEAEPIVGHEFQKARMFHDPIPMLAPGREHRLLFENMATRHGRTDLPDIYDVTVTYVDHRKAPHSEQFKLDLTVRRGARFVEVKTMHDAAKALQEIAKSVAKSQVVDGPVHVVTETRAQAVQREADQWRDVQRLDGDVPRAQVRSKKR